MVGDILLVRPACLIATVVGSALFVISLPIAAVQAPSGRAPTVSWCAPPRDPSRALGNLEELQH